MEVIEYRLDMRTLFFKRFLEVGVHIAGDRFDMIHPLQTDMIDEIVYDLLFLAAGDPENMSGFHVDDVGSISVTVVELEFINAEEFRMFFRLNELPVRCGIKSLKAFLVNVFYNIFAQAGKFCHFLVCVGTTGQEIADILMQFCRDPVAGSFKGNVLCPGVAAAGTYILVPCK